MDAQSQEMRDKSRLCPACRMPISALATKCRYCGETVVRPMTEEIRRLSVTDLGGAEGHQRALNESVVDALASFRREELERAASERQQHEDEMSRSWFGRKPPHGKPASPKDDMPELDARNVELSQITLSPTRKPTVHKRRERLWTKKLALAASFVAAVLLIWFGGGFVKAYIDSYLNRGTVKEEVAVENPALALLNQPGRTLDALTAAVRTARDTPNGDNQRVLDQVRNKALQEVNALLNANPWTVAQLDRASAMLTQAVSIDPDGVALKDLKQTVDEEVCAYKMTIANVDPAGQSATIRIVYPTRPADLVIKKKDEVVNGRFKVKRIGERAVTFEDPRRKDASGLPRTFSISMEGQISIQ